MSIDKDDGLILNHVGYAVYNKTYDFYYKNNKAYSYPKTALRKAIDLGDGWEVHKVSFLKTGKIEK